MILVCFLFYSILKLKRLLLFINKRMGEERSITKKYLRLQNGMHRIRKV